MNIRECTPLDAEQICEIYNYYIKTSIATFEVEPIDSNTMLARIKKVINEYPWLVACEGEKIIGYAYASRWKERRAYNRSVESTVYIREGQNGKGVGSLLYKVLLEELSKLKLHCVVAGISLPNQGSIALHEKMGFKKAGQFSQIGRKFNNWVDVGYWEYLIQEQ